LFQYYNQEFIKKIDGYWCYNGHQLAIFAAMDFAFSLTNIADYTVLIVIGLDHDGNIYILDIQRKRTNKTKEYYAMLYRAQQKWGFKKLRAEVTAAQEVIVERLKDDIRTDGLLLNNSVWHYAGGLCETLEQELIMHNPPHDDIKDALHSVFGIMKAPMARRHATRRSNVVTHARFGGVATG
jgi:hypothetical protein